MGGMAKTVSSILFILATFVLLLCMTFTAVQLVVADEPFFEREHKRLGIHAEMGMSVGDLAKSTRQMLDFMRGRADSLSVEVTIDGQVTQMFDLPIETVHMEEVRTLWRFFVTARNFGVLFVLALYAVAALLCREKVLLAWSRSYLFALAGFGVLAVIMGIWASSSFSDFWWIFHQVMFPGSSNWLLPAESRMVQMLPEPFFAAVIARAALTAAAGIGALLALAVGTQLSSRWRKARLSAIAEPAGWVQEPEPEGPDLLVAHKLRNAPIRKRRQIEQEVEEDARIREEMESFGDTVQIFEPAPRKTEE